MKEETVYDWEDAYGRRWKIEEIADDHLVNIIDHIRRNIRFYGDGLRDKFLGEARHRGLHDRMINIGQIPHISPRTGRWTVMGYGAGFAGLIEVSDKKARR